MDPKLSAALHTALSLWLSGAMEHVKLHKQHMAELRGAMEGDASDVRIVYCVRANAISIETLDLTQNTFIEIFREQLVPGGGIDLAGFIVPGSDTKQ